MRHNDLFPMGGGTRQVDPVQNASRGVASYSTPAVLLHAIEGIYGRDRYLEAYRAYARRWAYKHPYPYDLFNTFEDVLGDPPWRVRGQHDFFAGGVTEPISNNFHCCCGIIIVGLDILP
ncbi:MAG: hypothetical protein IIC18_03865 [Bacteroidetes bacterium]|nr:hypothetical protein [Bacteroidota bacterium]